MAMPTRVRKALSQGTGGRFHAGGMAVLGVARRFAAPLAETLYLIEAQVITGQVEEAVEQHRGMTAREDKPVAIGPLRVFRVVLQRPRPEDVSR